MILEEGLFEICNYCFLNGDFEEVGKVEGFDDYDLEIFFELVWVNSV